MPSVCFSACLFFSQHNSKTNDLKVFELGIGMTLDILEVT